MYYHRQLEKTVLKAAGEFACITLYGARQTGKSTMVRTLFDNIEYVTLDKGLIIDTGESILPLNRNAYYCPVGMIGL